MTESSLGPDASRYFAASRNIADAGAASATAPASISAQSFRDSAYVSGKGDRNA